MEIDLTQAEDVEKRAHQANLVTPGEVITDDPSCMRGHGTYILDGKLVASVAGIVERTGKLVSVKPLRSRYQGEQGDLVVGRVVEIANNRWKIDVNARHHAILQIGSISLHGDVHRRRTVDDALQMRSYYVENDLLVADVQASFADGALGLHVPKTYHKLENGVFTSVPPSLVRRVKTHFCTLPCGVDIVLGHNGYIWITPSLSEDEIEARAQPDSTWTPKPIQKDTRQAIARVKNAISILSHLFLPVFPDTIMYIYNNSLSYSVADLLKPEVIDTVSQGIESAESLSM